MEIKAIKLKYLQNEEHVRFHSEMKKLINHFSAETIGVERFIPAYEYALSTENKLLDKLCENSYTESIYVLDEKRDAIFMGFAAQIKLAESHYHKDIRNAAGRILFVIDLFIEMWNKFSIKETAIFDNFIEEITNNYDHDVSLLGLNGWLTELKKNNEEIKMSKKNKEHEKNTKSSFQMKGTRNKTDEVFHNIIQRVDALTIVNGEEDYLFFIEELNQHIDRYNRLLLRRKNSYSILNAE